MIKDFWFFIDIVAHLEQSEKIFRGQDLRKHEELS